LAQWQKDREDAADGDFEGIVSEVIRNLANNRIFFIYWDGRPMTDVGLWDLNSQRPFFVSDRNQLSFWQIGIKNYFCLYKSNR
jgi:hypothetical protein